MRIGILTWHKALNHGAVLQAYALQMLLQGYDYECGMLNYERDVKPQQSVVTILKKKIRSTFPWEYSYRKNIKTFEKEKRRLFDCFIDDYLNIYGMYENTSVDVAIIGSDMVFSLGQGYNPYMFGKGLLTNRLISYAASSGGYKIDLAKKMGVVKEISDQLKMFNAIGCRDSLTEEFVKSISGRTDTIRNIDPVLLYGFENELSSWDTQKWCQHSPYILLYSYTGNMDSKAEIEEIRRFASKQQLRVVSCGYYHPWCDENINASPREFLEMVKESKYIVTDTFHGTVFSIITRKPFVSMIRGNGFKLRELLCESGLSDRIADSTKEIADILEKGIDYRVFDTWHAFNRNKSLIYLKENIL